MVLSLEDAVTILNKWKEESARILAVAECPFRQFLQGIHGPSVDWAMGQHGKVSEISFYPGEKGKKASTVVLEAPCGNLSISIGGCSFIYEEPREAEPHVREEAKCATVSALSIFFPSGEVFVFYELLEPLMGDN